jgi:hypothetical protein
MLTLNQQGTTQEPFDDDLHLCGPLAVLDISFVIQQSDLSCHKIQSNKQLNVRKAPMRFGGLRKAPASNHSYNIPSLCQCVMALYNAGDRQPEMALVPSPCILRKIDEEFFTRSRIPKNRFRKTALT